MSLPETSIGGAQDRSGGGRQDVPDVEQVLLPQFLADVV